MKEKLLAQLKIARGQNASPSDRTLEQLATIASAGITEETQIPAIVEIYKPLMTEFVGETNHLIAEAIKNAKPAQQQQQQQQQQQDTEPTWAAALKNQIEALTTKNAEIEKKLSGQQQKEQRDAMVAKAKGEFYKKYRISDVEKPLFEKAVNIELTLNPTHEDHEKLVTGIKSQYEELRSTMGLGKVEPVDSGGGGGNKKPQQLLDLKAQMQKQGKLPKPEAAQATN